MIRLAGFAAAMVLLVGCSGEDPNDAAATPTAPEPTPTEPSSPESSSQSPETPEPNTTVPVVDRVVARDLEVPWGITFLPNGTALVGERDSTRVVAIAPSGTQREVGRIDVAAPRGEGGLLGLAASPAYASDKQVYAYVTTGSDNRVVRFTYSGGEIGTITPVLTGIPSAAIHDGGRLLFDEDGNLLVSTGDAGEAEFAQDPDSPAGKILRITPEGEPAPGNPDPDSPVWSLGHRNVQGLAFDDYGRLWASEFGQNTFDELNLIEPGNNYGWPEFEGKGGQTAKKAGFTDPWTQWETHEASPSGLAFAQGCLWLGALRGERLWRSCVDDEGVYKPKDFFIGEYGRMRTIAVTPEGDLWVTTSNRDSRGDPRDGDDKILLVKLQR